ncbi:MAG: hypothetical protein GTO67_14755 [Gammaproteobacteria bacterium]|nr:hypothetical protein [Gammaproteobacteria bacterium]NIM72310.1 hypothetical protein [Gammaproteobacteria bacterium]NIN39820.1 hypothetical protein [Gammaproteobacteria bacterium]NIO24069.1 hypothetical protein [Gammaproteobacteria bacterium]NIO64719.1 hypothetical protein [Gammaproteobacteria bacterium]
MPIALGGGADGFRMRYEDGTDFVIDRRGTRIWASWHEPMTLEDTAVYLLGPVLAFALRLRGVTCLHASAVVVDAGVVALVGPSGVGKSTTVAAFAERGFAVLCDDTLALEERESDVIAHPGYPRLRLWPEAVHLLHGEPAAAHAELGKALSGSATGRLSVCARSGTLARHLPPRSAAHGRPRPASARSAHRRDC